MYIGVYRGHVSAIKKSSVIYGNDQKLPNTKQGDTSKKRSITDHKVVTNDQIVKGGKIWEKISTINAWYRFIETGGQKCELFDGKRIPKQVEILESFIEKFRIKTPWEVNDLGNETNKGEVRNTITDILKMCDLDSSSFHLSLEDKLR